jgi:hypothetical protein
MNKLILSIPALFITLSVFSQTTRNDVLQGLEKDQNVIIPGTTATVKNATRLFKDKDDLTSVIMVIPGESVVDVLAADTVFLNVDYEGNKGYIYARHADLIKSEVPAGNNDKTVYERKETAVNSAIPAERTITTRYDYLINKYGRSLAGKINDGKIWKGMRSEMVKDSWGSPKKINRLISNNVVREDWYYNNTRLLFQNSVLVEWFRVKD